MRYSIYALECALKKVIEDLGLCSKLSISNLDTKLAISCNGTILYSILGNKVTNCFTKQQFISSSISTICAHIKDNLVDTLNKFYTLQNSFNLKSNLVENKLREVFGSSFNFNVFGSHFYIDINCNKFNIYYIGNGKYKVEPKLNANCNEKDMTIATKITDTLDGVML